MAATDVIPGAAVIFLVVSSSVTDDDLMYCMSSFLGDRIGAAPGAAAWFFMEFT
jgi:hypothetical protein